MHFVQCTMPSFLYSAFDSKAIFTHSLYYLIYKSCLMDVLPVNCKWYQLKSVKEVLMRKWAGVEYVKWNQNDYINNNLISFRFQSC